MLDNIYIAKFKKIGIFLVVFTLIFIFFFFTLKYTLPFVLGFIIAISTKKANLYLQKKLKVSPGISAIITTTIVFAILGVAITLLVYKTTTEVILLLSKVPSIDKLSLYIERFLMEITELVGQIDPQVVSTLYGYLQGLLTGALGIGIRVLNKILSIVLSLPSMFLIAIISFIATYFISKDYSIFSKSFYSIFSIDGKAKMRSIVESAITMTLGYAKAYMLVVFITFVQTFIGFSILKINYALILSIMCALLDLLPIVGTIIIYIPLIAYNFYIGNTLVAVGLIVLYIIVTVMRQIIEPKIVSTTLDLHPILILAAIFIGLKVSGVIGMIYFISLLVAYKILVKVNVI
ncbi:sporulation integral membrane protein YtvI [Tissierella sp. Yu-01]|uniref:sporulation integral membrane protein YtvI n=1 Tax=Tissierella sp. Yu-01 TaxID=3035694 RepID=UPI00240D81C7|nr:sporulation integral membrane protein YtvI [Tissierella sp. Yu-01]WFA10250.1 sporulation integral membrane protein YtvI [Tissierella sp. Yu-01]